MARYLKGIDTFCYIRTMNEFYGILITDQFEVRSVWRDTGVPEYQVFDKDGVRDTAFETRVGQSAIPDYVFINPWDTTDLSGTNITVEPLFELTDLGPDLAIGWDEFDSIGTAVMQYIPIRKEFTLSFTQKQQDAFWELILFGDYEGNFAHHGVHLDGTTPKLFCFEGKTEIGSDIGYQANIVLGQQSTGNWVIMRAMNLCLHSCTQEIAAAAITNRTVELSGNHGYLYAVADDSGSPNLTQFHWDSSVGAFV